VDFTAKQDLFFVIACVRDNNSIQQQMGMVLVIDGHYSGSVIWDDLTQSAPLVFTHYVSKR